MSLVSVLEDEFGKLLKWIRLKNYLYKIDSLFIIFPSIDA